MTIGKKISLGFASIVVLTAGLGGFAIMQFRSVIEDARTVEAAMPSLDAIADNQQLSRLTYGLTLEHVLATDPAELSNVEKELGEAEALVADAYRRYETNINGDKEQALYNTMKTTGAVCRSIRNEIIDLGRQQKDKEAMAAAHSRLMPATDAYMAAINDLWEFNQSDSSRATTEIVQGAQGGTATTSIGVVVAVLTSITLAFFIIRGVSRSLGRMASTLASGAQQTTSAAAQVSGASQSLAQGASEQAASLEETSASLEEMSSMTRKNAETAQQAAAFSSEAKTAADKGNAAMSKMSGAINDIQKSAAETAKIIKTIDEIAFQTNLLALNAAVEAARAGEAGKGFAVVAEEVRNLAMRSADAAKTTSSLIEGSVSNAHNGVKIVREVGNTLMEITSASEKVNGLIAEIAAASSEQAQGIGQVNTAVTQIDKVTQANAAAAEESAAASEELSSQAEQLSSVVSELMALVGGSGGERRFEPSSASPPASPARVNAASRDPDALHTPSHESRIVAAFHVGPVSREF